MGLPYFLYMVRQGRLKEKTYEKLLMERSTRSRLPLMALLALVLIFATLTISCSQVQVSPRLEYYSQSGVDYVGVKLKIPF